MTERLVADVGGTSIRLALAAAPSAPLQRQCSYAVADFDSIDAAITAYLKAEDVRCPDQVCLALAAIETGGDQVQMTNHDWQFSRSELQKTLACQQLMVINDFDAIGLALPHLEEQQLHRLREHSCQANRHLLAIGPGTGLGGSVWTEQGELLPCEPGHAGLSPVNELELDLFRLLLQGVDEVYAEWLLSGPGLIRLYHCLCQHLGSSGKLDSAAEICQAALAGDELAQQTVLLFCDLLGSAAGDLATSTGALGGIYIASGIVPRIIPLLEQSRFLQRLRNKGAQSDNLARVGVAIITDPQPGLLGAAAATMGH